MGEFTMPSLGADMEAGTVVKWLVKPGDEVHRGDIVAVVETEKSTVDVEIFESGVIDTLVVGEGERVPVGTVLALLTSAAPAPPAPAPTGGTPEEPERARPARRAAPQRPAARGAPVPGLTATLPPAQLHSPVLRHLAEQLGVDVARIEGSGPGGAVTRADVEQAARRRSGRPPASSPLARRLAAEEGTDLASLHGTGPGGAVVARDVRQGAPRAEATEAPPAAVAPAEPGPLPSPAAARSTWERQAALRQAIGALMARSKREIPHYYLSTTIDVGAATDWLERANLERPTTGRLVLPVLLLKATARAVAKVPEMNGFFTDAFTPSEAVHVGVAISLRSGGVIAPAIHDTDRLGLDDLMAQLHDLVGRARAGVLRSSEMADPTITVTNLGELGVDAVFGVIYPPQVALVGFGQVTERAVARGGMLGVRPCLTATLSADHRASDGHRGGRFLAEIDRLLQEPENL